MMHSTKKFKRLPPLAGVHFAGFKEVKIESRQLIVKQLRDFIRYCLKEAKSPAVQVILGEWGEGKTEAYQRYIHTEVREPNHAYLISASSLAQSLPKIQADSPLASLNLLAAVFYAVQHEVKPEKLPPFERYMDTERWLEKILQAYAKGRIIIFIDEFEELILNPPALRNILSGLKELINKQYNSITEEGLYPGIISFILSCTPDAYSRMQRDSEITEIFGLWDRRISKIHLAPVTRQEGIKFLYDLMRFSYEDRLPEPFPIKDLGVLYSLQNIGRGNLGALVTLFVKVFNSAAIDDETMYVINGPILLDILVNESISVYGGTANCVERTVLEGLEQQLGSSEIKLLRLLAGEFRPFSISELTSRLEINDEVEMSALVECVNQKLVNAGIANAIAGCLSIREDRCFDDLENALQPEIQEEELKVDGFTMSLGALKDDLTFMEMLDGEFTSRLFFPSNYRMISTAFEGKSIDSARRLERRVENLLDQKVLYYHLSNEVLFQLFPTPIPLGLEFIKDRDLRLKLWRDTTARFSQLFRDDMTRAIFYLLEFVEAHEVEVDDVKMHKDGILAKLTDISQNATVRCYCNCVYGDIGPADIGPIEERLQDESEIHLALVIHIGDISDEGREEIRAREMEKNLLLVPLHTSLAKRFLISYQCNTKYPNQVDEKLFVDTITREFKSEVELSVKLKEWIEAGFQVGIVLKDLYKATARGERDLADSLKFYINMLGEIKTPDTIFHANKRLMEFVPFGSRSGFIPDIESVNQLEKYTEDLLKNSFVQWNSDRTVQVTFSPPEKRLLKVLERDGTVARVAIRSYFIICAQAKNLLEDAYLNVLTHKGIIIESKGLLSLFKRKHALEKAKKLKAFCDQLLAARRQLEEWPAFGHIFVRKKREFRFISIHDLESYLDEIYENIQVSSQQGREEVLLQRTALLRNLVDFRNKLTIKF